MHRGEPINATWFVLAAVCFYLVAYRLYSAFIAAKLLALDDTRATPAERHDDGRDFVPTNKWVLFGHHFAAIAGPGPLVGPTLAAQFGYLPGTLWLIAGAAFAGCVQDFVILFCSIRRDGKSLGEMAREEVSERGGFIAQLAVLAIMVILAGRGGAGGRERAEVFAVGHVHAGDDHSDRAVAGRVSAILAAGARAGSLGDWRCAGVVLRWWPGNGWRIRASWAQVFTLSGVSLAFAHHRVRFCGVGAAGLAAAGAARLSERVHQGRGDFFARRWDSCLCGRKF